MLLLVPAALAAPLLLQDGAVPRSGLGQHVFAGADTDGDGLPEVFSVARDGWTGWNVSDLSDVVSVYSRERSTTAGADFVSLGPVSGSADVALLYGPGFSELVTPSAGDTLREALAPALELAREPGFHADGGRMLDGRYVNLVRYEPTGASYANLKAWTLADGFVACWSGPAGFALDFTVLRDFPAVGQERIVVASVVSSGTVVHAWEFARSGARGGAECSTVDVASGRDVIAEFPRPAAQVVFAPATARASGWFAFVDTTGILYAQSFTSTGMPAGTVQTISTSYARADISRAVGQALIAADVAGDSAPDLLFADPLGGRSGIVRLWVARTAGDGTVSFPDDPDWAWVGQRSGDGFGASIAAMPDLDGDDKAELLVGATQADSGAGRVELILSGTDGLDRDGDGAPDSVDCAPADPALYPGASVYADTDGDGYGDPSAAVGMACDGTSGWTTDATDCDDTDPTVYPGAPAWPDADGDGFGDAGAIPVGLVCEDAARFATQPGDCDDTNAEVSPQGVEVCNLLDDDCDGTPDEGVGVEGYPDADGDGFGAVGSALLRACDPAGLAEAEGDCDDTDAAVSPGAAEVPGDGLDNDCAAGDLEVAWGRGGCGCAGTPTPAGVPLGIGALALVVARRRGRRRP